MRVMHAEQATDGDRTGSGMPQKATWWTGSVALWGQHGGTEWGPYLGYGGGSGV